MFPQNSTESVIESYNTPGQFYRSNITYLKDLFRITTLLCLRYFEVWPSIALANNEEGTPCISVNTLYLSAQSHSSHAELEIDITDHHYTGI